MSTSTTLTISSNSAFSKPLQIITGTSTTTTRNISPASMPAESSARTDSKENLSFSVESIVSPKSRLEMDARISPRSGGLTINTGKDSQICMSPVCSPVACIPAHHHHHLHHHGSMLPVPPMATQLPISPSSATSPSTTTTPTTSQTFSYTSHSVEGILAKPSSQHHHHHPHHPHHPAQHPHHPAPPHPLHHSPPSSPPVHHPHHHPEDEGSDPEDIKSPSSPTSKTYTWTNASFPWMQQQGARLSPSHGKHSSLISSKRLNSKPPSFLVNTSM